jgi:hypothetical protein
MPNSNHRRLKFVTQSSSKTPTKKNSRPRRYVSHTKKNEQQIISPSFEELENAGFPFEIKPNEHANKPIPKRRLFNLNAMTTNHPNYKSTPGFNSGDNENTENNKTQRLQKEFENAMALKHKTYHHINLPTSNVRRSSHKKPRTSHKKPKPIHYNLLEMGMNMANENSQNKGPLRTEINENGNLITTTNKKNNIPKKKIFHL